jgi:hypothetical protein
VILNGASSFGKTTLATAFRDQQAAVGEFWLLIGIDDFLSKLPPAWLDLGLPTGPGKRAIEGLRFGTTPTGRELVVGETCRQLLHFTALLVVLARCRCRRVVVPRGDRGRSVVPEAIGVGGRPL